MPSKNLFEADILVNFDRKSKQSDISGISFRYHLHRYNLNKTKEAVEREPGNEVALIENLEWPPFS